METKKPRGFGLMSPERRRQIASMAGRKSQLLGVGHRFTSDEARAAGRKGGLAGRGKGES